MSDSISIRRQSPSAKDAAVAAWSRRVRYIGGFMQVGFVAFWLIRGSLDITGAAGIALCLSFTVACVGAITYGIRVTSGRAPRPTSAEGMRIENDVTIATLLQITASVVAAMFVIATDRADWALPAAAATIGPLLLWLDHRFDIPRYRPVGWAFIIGPVLLVTTMSGPSLIVVTGIAAGALLLATAVAGFDDLAGNVAISRSRPSRTGDPNPSTSVGAAFGAAVGLTVGLTARGVDGIPLSAAIGAGLGVALGMAIDASRHRRISAAQLLSDA